MSIGTKCMILFWRKHLLLQIESYWHKQNIFFIKGGKLLLSAQFAVIARKSDIYKLMTNKEIKKVQRAERMEASTLSGLSSKQFRNYTDLEVSPSWSPQGVRPWSRSQGEEFLQKQEEQVRAQILPLYWSYLQLQQHNFHLINLAVTPEQWVHHLYETSSAWKVLLKLLILTRS